VSASISSLYLAVTDDPKATTVVAKAKLKLPKTHAVVIRLIILIFTLSDPDRAAHRNVFALLICHQYLCLETSGVTQ
jgi:hypothetical protein